MTTDNTHPAAGSAEAKELALREIWRVVAEASRDKKGRLSKDELLGIMQRCAYGLGVKRRMAGS